MYIRSGSKMSFIGLWNFSHISQPYAVASSWAGFTCCRRGMWRQRFVAASPRSSKRGVGKKKKVCCLQGSFLPKAVWKCNPGTGPRVLRKTLRGKEVESTAVLAQHSARPAVWPTMCFHPKLKHGLGPAEDTLTVGALVLHMVHTHCVSELLNTISGVWQMCALPVKWKLNACWTQMFWPRGLYLTYTI